MGWMIFRLVLSLAFVAVVLVLAARLAKSRGLGGRAALIEVLARQPLGRTSTVNVIRVADRVFLVGSTEAQVTLLGEMDEAVIAEALAVPADPETGQPVPSAGSSTAVVPSGALAGSVFDRRQWRTFVQSLREKTVRRS